MITGASSGLGKVAALEMAKLGYHVIMVCRDQKRGLEALDEVQTQTGNKLVDLMICDLGSLASIKAFHQAYVKKYDDLNILINNAGLAVSTRLETADGFELQLGVNYLGVFALTNLMLPQLKKGSPARIINVTSMAYKSGKIQFNDLQLKNRYQSMNAYAQSKLAVVLFTRLLSDKLKHHNITVNCLHPGLSGTQMGVNRDNGSGKLLASIVKLFFQSPEKGAQTTLYLATSNDVAPVTGQYFFKKKVQPLAANALDNEVAEKLWHLSVQLTGIEPQIE